MSFHNSQFYIEINESLIKLGERTLIFNPNFSDNNVVDVKIMV